MQTLGERLYELRRKNFISQDELANMINVSRQSVSKWETNQAQPELDKIIALSQIFKVSTDYLLKGVVENNHEDVAEKEIDNAKANKHVIPMHFEYKSKTTVKGLPLVHINLGVGIYKAKGIIAIGNIAQGIFSLGAISIGIFSLGGLSIGLLAFGGLALGAIALGGFALALIIALGGFAMAGYLAIGGFALAYNAIGGFSAGVNTYGDIIYTFALSIRSLSQICI